MSDPFIGEIRLTPYNFAVRDWASCDGQLVAISQNDTLFSLLGTTYGGDGQNNFALPNLQSRIPIGQGVSTANGAHYLVAHAGGTETVTVLPSQMPQHTHTAIAAGAAGTATSPANAIWGGSTLEAYSTNTTALAPMSASALGHAGGSQPHENRMPYLALNFQICLWGIYPSRS